MTDRIQMLVPSSYSYAHHNAVTLPAPPPGVRLPKGVFQVRPVPVRDRVAAVEEPTAPKRLPLGPQGAAAVVRANPGLTKVEVARVWGWGSTRVEAALREAIRAKLIWVQTGPNNSHLHYAAGYWP